jgi:uncharacterized protein (TIGR03435 family)
MQLQRLWLLSALTLTAPTYAQIPVSLPGSYDVSTVKPSNDESHGMMLNWGEDRLEAKGVNLKWMVMNAFHLRDDQIVGLPSWATDQHWDIDAKLTDVDKETLKKLDTDQHRALLRSLLQDRFALKSHTETKVLPTYDLLPAKSGLKLQPGSTDKKIPGVCPGCSMTGREDLKAQNVNMSLLVEMIAGQVQRDVTNHTGVPDSKKVDVVLHFLPQDGKPANGDDGASEPLPAALEHQLGIKLVSTRGPVTLLVIDHLDKPNDN